MNVNTLPPGSNPVGPVYEFTVNGQKHHIWVEKEGVGYETYVGSTKTKLPKTVKTTAIATATAKGDKAAQAAAEKAAEDEAKRKLAELAANATKQLAADIDAKRKTEPAPPNVSNWGAYIGSEDILGRSYPGEKWPADVNRKPQPDPAAGKTTHAHHIAMKEKFGEEGSFESRQILRRLGIDPYTDRRNLVWAPNWSHSINYSRDVKQRLQDANMLGQSAVEEELANIARDFIWGKWYSKLK